MNVQYRGKKVLDRRRGRRSDKRRNKLRLLELSRTSRLCAAQVSPDGLALYGRIRCPLARPARSSTPRKLLTLRSLAQHIVAATTTPMAICTRSRVGVSRPASTTRRRNGNRLEGERADVWSFGTLLDGVPRAYISDVTAALGESLSFGARRHRISPR